MEVNLGDFERYWNAGKIYLNKSSFKLSSGIKQDCLELFGVAKSLEGAAESAKSAGLVCSLIDIKSVLMY